MFRSKLRRCTKCIMPETQELIEFDENGVCGTCRQYETKRKVDWQAKEEKFIDILNQYKGKYAYDCIIPVSGGKDSTFQVYTLVTKYKVKPLLVTFDHGFFRPTVLKNRVKTVKKLGVDIMTFRPNWHVTRRCMLEAFKRKGDFCWQCHSGVYAYPMQIAVKFNIPLVIWGEPSAEYVTSKYGFDQEEERDSEKFHQRNLDITAGQMFEYLGRDVDPRDFAPYRYPSVEDLKAINCRSIHLGDFIPWDTRRQAELIRRELDWEWDAQPHIHERWGYEKMECMLYGMRDYLLYIKKGFGRVTHIASIDIRNGRLSREEALKLAEEYDGKRPASMDWFLDQLGIAEKEFMDIALTHVVPPHSFCQSEVEQGKKSWDLNQWDASKPLSLAYGEK